MNDRERAIQALKDAGYELIYGNHWRRRSSAPWLDDVKLEEVDGHWEASYQRGGYAKNLPTLLQPPVSEDEEEAIRWAIAWASDQSAWFRNLDIHENLYATRAQALQGLLTRLSQQQKGG